MAAHRRDRRRRAGLRRGRARPIPRRPGAGLRRSSGPARRAGSCSARARAARSSVVRSTAGRGDPGRGLLLPRRDRTDRRRRRSRSSTTRRWSRCCSARLAAWPTPSPARRRARAREPDPGAAPAPAGGRHPPARGVPGLERDAPARGSWRTLKRSGPSRSGCCSTCCRSGSSTGSRQASSASPIGTTTSPSCSATSSGSRRSRPSSTPSALVEELNELFSGFDAICDETGVDKIKTIGDAYLAVGGLDGRRGAVGEMRDRRDGPADVRVHRGAHAAAGRLAEPHRDPRRADRRGRRRHARSSRTTCGATP